MSEQCFPLVGGRVMRVTRLDGCGRPDETNPACAQVTSDGFVSIEVTANIDEGDELNVKNAAGKTCVAKKPCPQFTGYSLNVNFCRVDPDLFSLTTGQDSIIDPLTGEGIGFDVATDKSGCDSGFALEVWSDVPGVSCPVDAQGNPITTVHEVHGYILFPFLQGGVFGDFTIENDVVTFTMQGAASKDGAGWGAGAYDVMVDGQGDASPLVTPVTNRTHLRVQVVNLAPPDPTCGCGPIPPRLNGPTAVTAYEGEPGFFGPAGAKLPADAAALATVVADPQTDWATDSYVELADGSQHQWASGAWAVKP